MYKTNMSNEVADRLKYDPSDIRQTFPDITLRLHCCRYWMLMEWEFDNLASPFWRLYYNTIETASVIFKGVTTALDRRQIIVIPPNTPFSTKLKEVTGLKVSETIARKKIMSQLEVEELKSGTASDHLFIHFNLGIPFDLLEPNIYTFSVGEKEALLLNQIKQFCIDGGNSFDFSTSAAINSLILGLLNDIPHKKWEILKLDKRVTNAINYIESHLDEQITNGQLSGKSNMAENSFARLFRENVGITIQQYIKKKRIDKALILLHHSQSNIEDIASQCGFTDRFHFSKVFKETMGISPVSYKKQLIF
jgi:AraC-like DNA-binding protein